MKKQTKKLKNQNFSCTSIPLVIIIIFIIVLSLITKKYKIYKDKSIKLIEENTFNMLSNNNNTFTICFQKYKNYIKKVAYYKNKYFLEEYEKKFLLDELKIIKYFSICNYISEVYGQLIYEYQKSKIKSLIELDNEINIIISIEYINVKNISI